VLRSAAAAPLGGRREMKKFIALTLVGVLAAFGLAACGDDDEAAGSDNVLHVTEDEYSYAFEGDVKAGTVTFDVENVGEEFHMLGVCALQDGKTVADVQEAAQADDESAFGDVCIEDDPVDGMGGGITPGVGYGITSTGLKAGKYVALCFLPDKDGKPHFMRGMIKQFEIGEGDEDAEIEGDITYTATKDRLTGPKEVDAGETTIEFVPQKGGRDEFVLLKLKDGKTADDVDAFFKQMDEGGFYTDETSPVSYLYFAFDDPNPRAFTVDLTPGKWAISATNSDEGEESVDPDEDPYVIQFTVS
jgi:hypothetical protein